MSTARIAKNASYPGVARIWPDNITDTQVAFALQARNPRRDGGMWTSGQVYMWKRGIAAAPDYIRPALADVLGLGFFELAGAYTVTE